MVPVTLENSYQKKIDPLAAAYERGRGVRAIMLEGALSPKEAAQKLGVNQEELDLLRQNKKILAITTKSKVYLYPKQQFHNNKLPEGLERVLDALGDLAPITQLSFLTTGDIRLEGKTPIECLIAGKIEQVEWAARCYGHQSAA
jgi:hypothetical protein